MKRFFVGLAAACVFALCIVGLVLVVRFQRQQAMMRQFIAAGPANLAREEREEAAARQVGIPLSARQLQLPLPPPGRNAASLYTKLTALLQYKPLGLPKYGEGMDAFHSYTPEQIATVRRTLAARQDVMMLVHQAADRPQCVVVRDWSQGLKLEFPEYQPMREAARLIKTESYLMARDRHYQGAINNQVRGFHIAEHSDSNSVLIIYLVGIANETITFSGMQSILALAGSNVAVSQQIQHTVRLDFVPLSLRGSLVNEAAVMEPVFLQLHQVQNRESTGLHPPSKIWGRGKMLCLIHATPLTPCPQQNKNLSRTRLMHNRRDTCWTCVG